MNQDFNNSAVQPSNILIVEDELLIAETLSITLEMIGYKITDIVSSGEKALQSIEKNIPDLVLMDIVLRGDMDGIETAYLIQKSYNIPVIYLTSYSDVGTLDRAKKTSPYGYLIKPFKENELRATIEVALQKYRQEIFKSEALYLCESIQQQQSSYLSTLSHELRTPLTTIQMAARMLQEYESQINEEKKNDYFNRIQSSIYNLNNMIDDFLVLCRAEAGKLELKPCPVNIYKFCKNLVEEYQLFLTGEKHHLIFNANCEQDSVYLDEKHLHYILSNLLTNAIKYSPQGGQVKLEVNCQSEEVIFSVEDSGIGIPSDYHQKLFERFERADNVGKIRGTGLGLSIVKQIVDSQGGEIQVESEVGVGTKVTVTLPFLIISSSTYTPAESLP